MNTDNGRTVSLWMSTADTPVGPKLVEDAACDVCVVGAGIAGLTTAYLLGRAGRRVVVLDKGSIGGGETAQTLGVAVCEIALPLSSASPMRAGSGSSVASCVRRTSRA